MPRAALFPLGQLVTTPGALEALSENEQDFLPFLARHVTGDWGIVDDEDKASNNAALAAGDRLISAYTLRDMTKIWIITEADRSSTCVLLPSEY